jgi:hypothetical protein
MSLIFKNLFYFFVFACIILSLTYIRNNRNLIESIYPEKRIRVQILGEVKKPGHYSVPLGTVIQDIFVLAGGLNPKANIEYVDVDRELKDGEVLNIGTGM